MLRLVGVDGGIDRSKDGSARRGIVRLASVDPIQLACSMTLLFLIGFFANGLLRHMSVPLLLPVAGAIGLGILRRDLLQKAPLWFTLFGAFAITLIADNKYSLPNHFFVATYWALAMGCVFSCNEPEREPCLRFNAKWIVVLCMGIAGIQKMIARDFPTGGFIHYALLTGQFSLPGIGYDEETIRHNLSQVGSLFVPSNTSAQLQYTQANALVAKAMAWTVIGYELVLAGLFATDRFVVLKHAMLIFLFGYIWSEAEFQFGLLVCMLGAIICPREHVGIRSIYLTLALAFFVSLIAALK